MRVAVSYDGAGIAYDRGGEGPPLLLVHGTISDRTIWEPIRSRLEKRFTVYTVHRRGREGSAPLGGVDFEREFRDVACVVDDIGEPTHVVGHSFGAHCALGAALYSAAIRNVLLYEPPAPEPRQRRAPVTRDHSGFANAPMHAAGNEGDVSPIEWPKGVALRRCTRKQLPAHVVL